MTLAWAAHMGFLDLSSPTEACFLVSESPSRRKIAIDAVVHAGSTCILGGFFFPLDSMLKHGFSLGKALELVGISMGRGES